MRIKQWQILLLLLCAGGTLFGQSLRAGEAAIFLKNGDLFVDRINDISSRRFVLDTGNSGEIALRDIWMINLVDSNWNFPEERNQIETNDHYIFMKNGSISSGRIVDFSSTRRFFQFESGEEFPIGQIRRIYFSRVIPESLKKMFSDIKTETTRPTGHGLIQPLAQLQTKLQTTHNHLRNTRNKLDQILAETQNPGIKHNHLTSLIRAATASLELARSANDQGLKQTKALLDGEQIGSSGKQTSLALEPNRTHAIQEKIHAPQQVTANHLNNLHEKLERLLHGTLKKNLDQSQLNSLARAAIFDLDSACSAHDSARENLGNI